MPIRDPQITRELLSHQTFLTKLASDLVGADADDLVQEVWRRALERPPQHGKQLRSWLARVARNLATDRWRGDVRRREREQQGSLQRLAQDELEARFELRKELIAALDSLPEPSRETILLRYFEGLSPREIAARQDAPVATVKTRLRRGLAQLREALDERHGGVRATWMPAVTALGAPGGSIEAAPGGMGTTTLLTGGILVGTILKVSIAALAAAAGVYFLARGFRTEAPSPAPAEGFAVDPLHADPTLADPVTRSLADGPSANEGGRRSLDAQGQPFDASADVGTRLLRAVLEGVDEEYAQRATVTVQGVEAGNGWPARIEESWSAVGSTSEFDLDAFFERMAKRGELRDEELVVVVEHPLHFSETIPVPLSSGVEENGQTVYEARVRLAEVVYWPELTLAVRDASTRADLEGVELRAVPTAFMGSVQQPGASDPFSRIGTDLQSPIVLRGGRKAGEPEELAAGMALVLPAGEALQPAELTQPEENARGILVYARAPGYAWSRLVLDVSQGGRRELLLDRGAALRLRLANVQPERYAARGKRATVFLRRIRPDGNEETVWSRSLDRWLETDPLRIESLEPGEYAVLVELSSSWQRKPLELGRETIFLPTGEDREVLLSVPDPPEPPTRANLGGVVSFPRFGGEEDVRLEFYGPDYRYGEPDFVLPLAEAEPLVATLPTWSFLLEDLPVGRYQVRLLPFLKSWMIELSEGGRDDVELVIPELAEVLVETVDARTGEGIPFETIVYRTLEVLPGQVTHGGSGPWLSVAFEGEPGRFRFWTTPGAVGVKGSGDPTGVGYGHYAEEAALGPGLHSLRLELSPACLLRFEFRVDGTALPHEDRIYVGLSRGIHAVGHEGRSGGMYPYSLVETSAPGLYEIRFEGVGTDRFLPIPPRQVEVREGETTEVIVELQRK